jgi:hypothetical protein
LRFKFPVLSKSFPVIAFREFAKEDLDSSGEDCCTRKASSRFQRNSLFFSLLPGNCIVETGSRLTASTTNHLNDLAGVG